ncbi:SLATT domain-containing protein [Bradyrhizobium sp. 139]|uniref:SLATT domain-containing protein n=1 Tax=Bradyrhizobium sp. 139 TaxID=2782616 RepID=UPI001FF7CB00|nr:SLATT domain-containing protein [Bradyrhizobium sp. 139]
MACGSPHVQRRCGKRRCGWVAAIGADDGLPVVIISALVGAATFSQYADTYPELKALAGFLSLTIAVLSGISTFLNPNEKESAHLNAAHGYDKLNNEGRLFWSVECWQEESDLVLTTKLRELISRKDELNSGSPQIPGWAYKKAKAGIVAGEAKFEVDNPSARAFFGIAPATAALSERAVDRKPAKPACHRAETEHPTVRIRSSPRG